MRVAAGIAPLCVAALLAGCNSRTDFYAARYDVACPALAEPERSAEILRVAAAVRQGLGLPAEHGTATLPVQLVLPIARRYNTAPQPMEISFTTEPPRDFFDKPHAGYVIEVSRPLDGDDAMTEHTLSVVEDTLKRSACPSWGFSSWAEKLG